MAQFFECMSLNSTLSIYSILNVFHRIRIKIFLQIGTMMEYKDLALPNISLLGDRESLLSTQFLLEPNTFCENSIFCIFTSKMKKKFATGKKEHFLKEISDFKAFLENLSIEQLSFPREFIDDGLFPIIMAILESGNLEEQVLVLETIELLLDKSSSIIAQSFSNERFSSFLFNEISNPQFNLNCILHLLYKISMNSENDIIHYNNFIDPLCNLANSIIEESKDFELVDKILAILTILAKVPISKDQTINIFSLIDHINCLSISRQQFYDQYLELIYNIFQTESIIFDVFENFGFFERIQQFIFTTECTPSTLYSCLLISSIYPKFPYQYQFSIQNLLQLILNNDIDNPLAEKCSKAASQALCAQFEAAPPLVQHLYKDGTLESVLQMSQIKSADTKQSLFSIYFALIDQSSNETLNKILSIDRFSVFDYVVDIYYMDGESIAQAFHLLLLIFKKSTEFDLLELCKSKFFDAFDEQFLDQTDFDSEEIENDFLELRKYLM